MDWKTIIDEERVKPYYIKMKEIIDHEYETKIIYPPKKDIYNCFKLCPYDQVKVVILGQDPYHQPNQAHGLSFSVNKGIKLPPSLVNIYKELEEDLGIPMATHGCLVNWARQGVLLMNTALTVEQSKPNSHKDLGWITFTDEMIRRLNESEKPIVFILWGRNAQDKQKLITNPIHGIIKSAHPSPLSAYNGFFHSHPFSRANEFLIQHGREAIDWHV